MTDPDPSADPTGADVDASDSTGAERGGSEPGADADGRATPRLADTADADGEDRPADGSEAFREPEPIEPQTLRAENAVFVVLGALGTVALLATVVVPGIL